MSTVNADRATPQLGREQKFEQNKNRKISMKNKKKIEEYKHEERQSYLHIPSPNKIKRRA